MSDDDVDLEPDELGEDFGGAFGVSLRPPILDRDSATFNPTEFTQSLYESVSPFLLGRRCGRAQESDGRQFHRLLPVRCERPRRRPPSEQRDELAPGAHSITSSAAMSRPGGTVRPSA